MTCSNLNCPACLVDVAQRLRGTTSSTTTSSRSQGPKLKRSLMQHAKRFGWDQVEETAKQLGIELDAHAPKKESLRAKATRLKKDRAWEYYDEGKTAEEIAALLSCSLSTVKKYLARP